MYLLEVLFMKCLVFSDSHGSPYFIQKAISLHPDADVIFFLGDGLDDISEIFERYPNKNFLAFLLFLAVHSPTTLPLGIYQRL